MTKIADQSSSQKPSGKATSAKGAKARAKIKSAALTVLEDVGYHRMRITDVTGQAGVASGLFYHYFKDLKSLTIEVLEDFVAHSLHVDDIEKDVPRGDWYARMYAHNKLVVAAHAERPGIMRAMLQLADEDTEFSGLLRRNFLQQLQWLTRQMPRLFPDAGLSEQQALLVVYTLAGTGETILRDYYVNRESVLCREALSIEQMTELITVMFYRGLFLKNPEPEKLKYTVNLQHMHRD